MACISCSGTMHSLGCKVSDMPFFWCPRCGAIKPCDNETVVPALIGRLRIFEEYMLANQHLAVYDALKLWEKLGIKESIHEA